MATSSIFASVTLTDPKSIEAFLNVLEESECGPKRKQKKSEISLVTDLDDIKKFLTMGDTKDE
ncbi:MAG: hypothetical protein IJ468_13020 [Lachnospiraceae bacterium]|nr:hypothetical protein [Lachnospiraceae bacterium]